MYVFCKKDIGIILHTAYFEHEVDEVDIYFLTLLEEMVKTRSKIGCASMKLSLGNNYKMDMVFNENGS